MKNIRCVKKKKKPSQPLFWKVWIFRGLISVSDPRQFNRSIPHEDQYFTSPKSESSTQNRQFHTFVSSTRQFSTNPTVSHKIVNSTPSSVPHISSAHIRWFHTKPSTPHFRQFHTSVQHESGSSTQNRQFHTLVSSTRPFHTNLSGKSVSCVWN